MIRKSTVQIILVKLDFDLSVPSREAEKIPVTVVYNASSSVPGIIV